MTEPTLLGHSVLPRVVRISVGVAVEYEEWLVLVN